MIIGIDVGGTHTDGVLIKAGHVSNICKVKTDRTQLQTSILQALDTLLAEEDNTSLQQIVFSTTLTTNLIAQGKYPPTGLVLMPGPGVDPSWLKIANNNWLLAGSIDHRGRKVANLNEDEVNKLIEQLKQGQIHDLAIVGKFSSRNPELESEIAKRVRLSLPDIDNIQLGSIISPTLNFPRRVQTTWLNTAVYREYLKFISSVQQSIEARGIHANLYLLKADGGTMPLYQGLKAGVETIKSGPAASIMGLLALTPELRDTSILLDVGGTTTDIALMVHGIPLFEPAGVEVQGYTTSVRGLLNRSISYGGDSLVKLKQDGHVALLPQRVGPAAAFGGTSPTLTDALIITGLMNEGDHTKAHHAFRMLLNDHDEQKILISAQETIQQFYQIITESIQLLLDNLKARPVYTIHELLHDLELQPKTLLIIGGPAKALLPGLAKKLKLKPVLPDYYQVANALGAALARPTLHQTLYADTAQKYYILSSLNISDSVIKQRINHRFTLENARQALIEHTQKLAQKQSPKAKIEDHNIEITFEESFNIVRDFRTEGQIFRLEAQIKPGIQQVLLPANSKEYLLSDSPQFTSISKLSTQGGIDNEAENSSS